MSYSDLNNTYSLLLNESYLESKQMLQDAIKSARAPFWQSFVITTATERQAEVCRKMVMKRVADGYLPKSCDYTVVPDIGGQRIGSGGSTLNVLAQQYKACGCDIGKLLSRRTLILHSGGDAKRMPHAAPLGKLFALSGGNIWDGVEHPPASVFDDLSVSLAGMPSRMRGGVVVVSADAFFRFNHTQADMDTPDAIAFAMKAPVSEGTMHGVFQANPDGEVESFLHKLPEDELRAKGAVSGSGSVDLDIGLTYLGENAIRAMLGLALTSDGTIDEEKLNRLASPDVRLSFYGDIIYSMARGSTLESYMEQPTEGERTPELLALRPAIFEALHPIRLWIARLSPGALESMGTTAEAVARAGASGCRIDSSRIPACASIGKGCIVSDCDVPEGFELPSGLAMQSLPLSNGKWVCRVWGVNDDPKSAGTWLNRPFDSDMWGICSGSLWEAPLFPVCNTQAEAVEWAGRLARGLSTCEFGEWKRIPHLSLADTENVDIPVFLARREALDDQRRIDAFAGALFGGSPMEEALPFLGLGENASRRICQAVKRLESKEYTNWADAMRLYIGLAKAVEQLSLPFDADALTEAGFGVLRRATMARMAMPVREKGLWARDRVEVSLPVRVNWGGSWSDAPPYCFEHGGTLVNAAMTMDGNLPINVTVERLDEPVVECESVDLRTSARFTSLEPLLAYQDPTDAFMLFKAALIVAGVISSDGGSLHGQLASLGGGLRITTRVDVPKGSGLGTSSILSGALIDALTRLLGRPRDSLRLSGDVLLAEQLMTTGGGWQDAIGGMIPGIKLTHTAPGIPQEFDIQQVEISAATRDELSRRSFLLYTGQRRLAKSVLRRVLTNYILNNQASLDALEQTRRNAVLLSYELKRGNIPAVGELISAHMDTLRRLDPSSSNLMLDHMMSSLRTMTEGVTICGAGGGGFMYGLLRTGVPLAQLQTLLSQTYSGTHVKLFAARVLPAAP